MVVGAVVVVGAAVFFFFSPFFFVCFELLMNKTTMIVHLATEKEEMDFFHAHLRAGGTLSWLCPPRPQNTLDGVYQSATRT